jgi:uncharacterized membrane protein YqaE (UPF0057 family)
VDFLRILLSILVPPLGMFLQVGLTVPAQKYKILWPNLCAPC